MQHAGHNVLYFSILNMPHYFCPCGHLHIHVPALKEFTLRWFYAFVQRELTFSAPCLIVICVLQEREMGGGIFYDPLYRETFTQELHMLTK